MELFDSRVEIAERIVKEKKWKDKFRDDANEAIKGIDGQSKQLAAIESVLKRMGTNTEIWHNVLMKKRGEPNRLKQMRLEHKALVRAGCMEAK